jgi:hypothetical protein
VQDRTLMKPLSPLAHTVGADSPTVGLSDWLAGARPVVGTVAASGMLLAVCSWFALGTGGFGQHKDVGQSGPVRLHSSPGGPTRPGLHGPARAVHARADAGRASSTPRPHNVGNTVSDAGSPAPTSQPGRPDSTPAAAQPTPTASTPAAQPAVAVPSTTNLPAPLDEVPTTVTVPPTPVTPGVTVPLPQTPSVPAPSPVVTTVTSTLGLP